MSQVIPFLSAREINKAEDYERLFHTKNYIRQNSKKIKDSRKPTEELLNLMKASNYSKFQKFREHRYLWDNCKKDIPLSYLKAIGINLEILKFAVELDIEEYERALEIAHYPKYFTIRRMACVYQSIKIPDGFSESRAIEFAKEYKSNCCIVIEEFKSIFIEPNGNVKYYYYRPEVKINKRMVSFGYAGTGIGTVRI